MLHLGGCRHRGYVYGLTLIVQMGTLEIQNIDIGTRVNRCKAKLVRQPSAVYQAQIKVDEHLVLPVSRQTQPTRPQQARSEAPLASPDPPEVANETGNRRGVEDASNNQAVEHTSDYVTDNGKASIPFVTINKDT